MKSYQRALIVSLLAWSGSMPAVSAEPQGGAVQPAAPPATPAGAPATGFPVLVIPAMILVGAAVALGVSDNDADLSIISGTSTGTQ